MNSQYFLNYLTPSGLQLLSIYANMLCMLVDPPQNKESARERAMRLWRNAHIQKSTTQKPTTTTQQPAPIKHEHKLHNTMLKLLQTKSNDTIQYYVAMIRHKKHQLLTEKLRRLKEKDHIHE